MKNWTLLVALASVVTVVMADEPVVVKDTRAFSCGKTNESARKCATGETPWAVSGELTKRFGDGFCERHTYSLGGGNVYRSDDGRSQIQMPAQVDRISNFRCDSRGNAV